MRLQTIKNFITTEERDSLVRWIVKEKVLSTTSNSKRIGTRNTKVDFYYPEIAFRIQQRILDSISGTKKVMVQSTDKDGMFVMVTEPGGSTHAHKDIDDSLNQGTITVRCNIVLQSPDAGGDLYIENKVFDFNERDLHCYNATDYNHWVTELEGSKSRYLWAFGFNLPRLDWENGYVKVEME